MKFSTSSLFAIVSLAVTSPVVMSESSGLRTTAGKEKAVWTRSRALEEEAQEDLVLNEQNHLGLNAGKSSYKATDIFHSLVAGHCVADHECAAIWGDPHLVTFDGRKYDCMGKGEYILLKSSNMDFQIQGRFVDAYYPNHDDRDHMRLKNNKPVTITEAVAIETGFAGAPQIDIFTVHEGKNQCSLHWFADGKQAHFGADGHNVTGVQFYADQIVGKETVDYMFFPDSGIMITVFAKVGGYGCVLAVKVCIPPFMLKEMEFVGLLGNPTGTTADEWMDKSGNPIPFQSGWQPSFDYCTTNWCVESADESIFGYVQGSNWASQAEGGCADGQVYDPQAEIDVLMASDACKECCAPAAEGIDMIQCLTECVDADGDGIEECVAELEQVHVLETVQEMCPDPFVPKRAPPRPAGTQGDPHFRTHGGEMYDFHGGCDLVLLDNPDFKDGLGMLVHVRTKIETWWSYVESAAVRIGDQTLEINGGDKGEWLFTNGIANEALVEQKWYTTKFAGLVLRFKKSGPNREAHIYLKDGKKLVLKTYNDFVKVELGAEGSELFKGSHGLLGRFPDGKRVGRDGETLIEDVNVFGQEWQVKTDEPKLFHSYEGDWIVPAGQTCAMPSETLEKKELRARRLASGLSLEEADKACAHMTDPSDHKACVFDVVATQDLGMAAVW